MNSRVSVIIPAHNPREDYLRLVLDALRRQTLPLSQWDLIVVDNRSSPALTERLDLGWHPAAEVVREERIGLTHARVAGFAQARGELIVLVDDDNVLAPDYLEQANKISVDFPLLGSWGGQVELALEDPTSPPPPRLRYLLCERTAQTLVWSNDPSHIASTPWGAGMCVRRPVADAYIEVIRANPRRLKLDLQGGKLAYGGDTDIAYVGCEMGLGMGVFPQLKLAHLIPRRRCTTEYLLESLQAHAYSEVLHHWVLTGVIPKERRDWRGRIGAWLRWLAADRLGRSMIRAGRRGRTLGRTELESER